MEKKLKIPYYHTLVKHTHLYFHKMTLQDNCLLMPGDGPLCGPAGDGRLGGELLGGGPSRGGPVSGGPNGGGSL